MHQNAFRFRIVNMRENHRGKSIDSGALPELPSGLFERIMERIEKERRVSAQKRLFVFFATACFSAAALVPVFGGFRATLAQSNFLRFAALFFSDFRFVVENWRDFGLILLEALPAVSAALLLCVVFALLWSLLNLAKTAVSRELIIYR